MPSLGQIFKKYNGFLRRLRIVYFLNNLLNLGKLKRNRELYRQYGLKKSVLAPISSADFKEKSKPLPWLDQPDALKTLQAHPGFKAFDAKLQQEMIRFVEDGYMILEGFYDEPAIDRLNEEVGRLLGQQGLNFNYTRRKIMDGFRQSTLIDDFFRNPELLEILAFILGRPVVPFQTINFIEGSEQRAHSDFYHMTTEPQGYLIASWTALEDCHEGNGPLFYYPGSHRLPYVTYEHFDAGHTALALGKDYNAKYEAKIEAVIQKNGLQKEYFFGKKGDILIWHANLLHGGAPISKKGTTRRSMVAHYYGRDVICYHEITQRPAILEE